MSLFEDIAFLAIIHGKINAGNTFYSNDNQNLVIYVLLQNICDWKHPSINNNKLNLNNYLLNETKPTLSSPEILPLHKNSSFYFILTVLI